MKRDSSQEDLACSTGGHWTPEFQRKWRKRDLEQQEVLGLEVEGGLKEVETAEQLHHTGEGSQLPGERTEAKDWMKGREQRAR